MALLFLFPPISYSEGFIPLTGCLHLKLGFMNELRFPLIILTKYMYIEVWVLSCLLSDYVMVLCYDNVRPHC